MRTRDDAPIMAIDFVGFTSDHRITGRLPLADDRLSDMLNSVARVVIRGAMTEEIDTGRVDDGDVMVMCGDLLVVVAEGRRGVESQRRRTVTRHVRLGIGRFVVEGQLHLRADSADRRTAGGIDELLAGRDLLVPVTAATLTYDRAGRSTEQACETMLINRAQVRWMESDDDTAGLIGAEQPEEPVRTGWARQLKSVVKR
jgi:hypothetical protein